MINAEKMREFVVVRGPPGVYAGYLLEEKGMEVELADAFCLWRYSGAANLNQLAIEGVANPEKCKFSQTVPTMRLKGIFQIIPCSQAAKDNLLAVKKWKV